MIEECPGKNKNKGTIPGRHGHDDGRKGRFQFMQRGKRHHYNQRKRQRTEKKSAGDENGNKFGNSVIA